MRLNTMCPQADIDWDDSSEVRQRLVLESHPDTGVTLEEPTLRGLGALAASASGREARSRAVALRAALAQGGAQDGGPHPLHGLIDTLVDRAEELERLRRLASRDELTGIANRRSFQDSLDRALARAVRSAQPLSLVLFDLDGLKTINDRFGHAAGDTALCEVATRAQALVRIGDLAARLGGDEFVVLLPDTGREEATAIGERIREELSRLDLGISFGVSTTDDGHRKPQPLLEAADRELYRDKRARKTLRPSAV